MEFIGFLLATFYMQKPKLKESVWCLIGIRHYPKPTFKQNGMLKKKFMILSKVLLKLNRSRRKKNCASKVKWKHMNYSISIGKLVST